MILHTILRKRVGPVRDVLGRFAKDILEIQKIGGTPHADRDVRVQKHKGFATF